MDPQVEKQLSDLVGTVKFLLQDTRQLAKTVQALEEDLAETRDRLAKSEELRAMGAVPVGPAIAMTASHESDHLLDLPLAKVLDLYGEVPQVLTPYCRRAAINQEQSQGQTSVLERNSQGNYWVLQLRDQGLLLLPRPGAFNRLVALESLRELFDCTGELRGDGSDEFCVVEPARLGLIKRHQCWQLEKRGQLQFGTAPLEHRWRQQLRQIEQDYRAIAPVLEEQGVAGLQMAIASNAYAQKLHQQYGAVKRVLVNTCMPMAYARYRDAEENAWLVPCSVQLLPTVKVFPAWDAGVPWKTSQFEEAEIVRARVENSALPGQAFLRDGSEQTWAIANSYEEASTLIDKLIGRWGPLFEPR
ncbi:hypothetical protein [Synechococcus elongatus]|uniref:hypothetical protein n=1 Tax=Synechococcus elongatus TaxID=32046 RepID=UPI000F7F673C|nr:hypothetical protein [Synechococcus elongatus]